MTSARETKKPVGKVVVHADECKGCALCVDACPVGGLQISRTTFNRLGYHPIEFLEVGCTGCGVCFYACPEPGALRVLRPRRNERPKP
jgi:ferredoxin